MELGGNTIETFGWGSRCLWLHYCVAISRGLKASNCESKITSELFLNACDGNAENLLRSSGHLFLKGPVLLSVVASLHNYRSRLLRGYKNCYVVQTFLASVTALWDEKKICAFENCFLFSLCSGSMWYDQLETRLTSQVMATFLRLLQWHVYTHMYMPLAEWLHLQMSDSCI